MVAVALFFRWHKDKKSIRTIHFTHSQKADCGYRTDDFGIEFLLHTRTFPGTFPTVNINFTLSTFFFRPFLNKGILPLCED